jgi:hypothetical protein
VMRTVFPTKELRDEAVEKYHAIDLLARARGHRAALVVAPNGSSRSRRREVWISAAARWPRSARWWGMARPNGIP